MSPAVVYVLTALAGVVVVLTRVRLRRRRPAAGRSDIARGPVGVHTVSGVLGLAAWLVFLVGGDRLSEATASLVGIVALVLWWVAALAGLLILARWLPNKGTHASIGTQDSWSSGPGLSLLAHLGMVAGVVVFTYAYLVKVV